MSFRTIAKVTIIFLSTWQAASAQSQKETNMHTVQSQTEPRTRARAKAKITVQSSEIVENGKIKATWFIVPGSGTVDLSGLRGEGGFEGDFGKGSDGWLDY